MKKIFLTIGLLFAISGLSHATTSPEILKPYEEYRAALENGDKAKAYKFAKKAWETAEDVLGDSKTTGDLAANFAALEPPQKHYSYKHYEKRMKAHKRSIELASFYNEGAIEVELKRHLKRIETGLTLTQIKRGKKKAGGKTTYFSDMEKALDKYDRKGSPFEGDMEVLRVRYHEFTGNTKKGLDAAKRAERIYANNSGNHSSHYPSFLKLFKGNLLKKSNKPIEAALEYQDLMQNLKGKLPAEHMFIKTAFREWLIARSELDDAGRLEEAELAGLCNCWPFDDYKDEAVPLKRVPPKMPKGAKHSGHVILVFDVSESGNPFNIRVLSSTEKLFEAPAVKSVKQWVYSPSGRGENEKTRNDVSSMIFFKLINSSGDIISPKR